MTRPDRPDLRTWFAVVRAYATCERKYARLLSHFDLTIPQFDAMTAVERRGGEATASEVAESLMVTRGNVSGLIRRLEERGLITIEPHPRDARSVRCALTPAARARMARARLAADAFIGEQMAPFDASALAETEVRMEQMRRHLERMDPDAIAARLTPRREKPRACSRAVAAR